LSACWDRCKGKKKDGENGVHAYAVMIAWGTRIGSFLAQKRMLL
jgi:hypothetical protein